MWHRMPWGKFRGRLIEDIPSSYLVWVLEECDNVQSWLEGAIKDELARRFCRGCRTRNREPRHEPPSRLSAAALENKVRSWFSHMALKYHPDRGGSDEAMQAINFAHEHILELLEIGEKP